MLVEELHPSTSSLNLGTGGEVLVEELHPSTSLLNLGTEGCKCSQFSEAISMGTHDLIRSGLIGVPLFVASVLP